MEEENHGWVMFHRRSLESSVWKNPVIWWVWSWCLLKANHQDNIFPFNGKDVLVKKGQFITGLFKASSELKLPPQKVRTAWRYLINTQRITNQSTNQFTLITILKWDKYQQKDKQDNKPITNEQQTDNKRITTNNNDKNVNNDKNEKKREVAFAPPSLEEVKKYCEERKNSVNPQNFLDFYSSKGWMIGKNRMKDWRAAVRTWEGRENRDNKITTISAIIEKKPIRFNDLKIIN